VRTALFWHIPWPYPDRLRICPWSSDILAGLLANDLLAFQVERDRRNFLAAVSEELDAEVEEESSRVYHGGRRTTVVAVPIGVDYDRIQTIAADRELRTEQKRLRALLGLEAEIIGLGVDRLDYTKGIPERLAALDARRAEWDGRVAAYRAERDALRVSQRPPEELAAALTRLRDSRFAGGERVRIQALEAAEPAQPAPGSP
jgi:trehalose 6-phosphate synthase